MRLLCVLVSGVRGLILAIQPRTATAAFHSKHLTAARAPSPERQKWKTMQRMLCSAVYLPVNDTYRTWRTPRSRPDWVITSLRNADVTWPRCARRLSSCQAAGRRAASFASFLEQQLRRAHFLIDASLILHGQAEHLLKAGCGRQEESRGESRGYLALLIGNVRGERGRWWWWCVAKYRLFTNCVRAHFHLATATAPNLPSERFQRIETSYSWAAA